MLAANYRSESYRKAKSMLLELNKDIKSIMPLCTDDPDFETPGHVEIGAGSIDGVSVERVIAILRGCGCEWALKTEGGCTMCGHLSGSSMGKEIPSQSMKNQFDFVMNRYDFDKYPLLCLYNGGSFLNEKEISSDLRKYMLERISGVAGIKRLIIESRPEYIDDGKLDELEMLLPSTTVEIGVGVETADDSLRDLVLNKGVSGRELKEAGEKFRGRKTKLLAYVLVNPPFLTESEAIEDTISSIEFAAKIGAEIVSLEAVSIQHLTLVSFLAEAGYYNTPWIWSIFEILKKTFHLGVQLRLGGFEFFPIPREFTSNCPACDKTMVEKIQEFNKFNDLKTIENLSCPGCCDLLWREELKKVDSRDLPERIIQTLDSIDTKEILYRLKHQN